MSAVADAAYNTVHDYPGGAEALAPRMGKSAKVLDSKVSRNVSTHHLTLHEAVQIMGLTGDHRMLRAICRHLGYLDPIRAVVYEGIADEQLLELVAAGEHVDAAASEVGVPKGHARRWVGWTGPPPLKVRGRPGTLQHFRAWSRLLRLEDGSQFRLEPFQTRILANHFAGVRELVVLLPKGNGKSVLLGALALYHLEVTVEARCYIAAASRDQAGIIFGAAVGFAKRSPGLAGRYDPKQGSRQILSVRDQGFIRVLAADANTADGVAPTLALVDELHRHPSGELLAVFRGGLGKRGGQLVTISTAGSDPDSPLGLLRRAALAQGVVEQRGTHTRAVGRDGSFVLEEWSLGPDDDLDDLRLVKRTNPARFVTARDLRLVKDAPGTSRAQWARFHCNVWAQDDDSAISELDWGRCAFPDVEIPDGAEVLVGVDLGWKWDTTALVPCEALGGERVRFGRPVILVPPQDGTMLDERLVWDALVAMCERWAVRVVLDPNAGGQRFAQRVRDELGVEVLEHSQDPSPMSDASMRFAGAVGGGLVEHPGDEAFTAQVCAAAAKSTIGGEKWRLVKGRARRPIDAAIAAAMAYRVATADRPSPPALFAVAA